MGGDANLSASERGRYAGQMTVLQPVLGTQRALRVLDVGCGQAGLLRTLHERYPGHSYWGVDPNVSVTQRADQSICFSTDWKTLDGSFDLIILSHVIEHLVDFEDIAKLSRRLTEGGKVYIEVPDASRYGTHLRREFLYYLDRLHINHFTESALRRLMTRCGLHTFATGRSEFEYKDSKPFPAIYAMASGTTVPTTPEDGLPSGVPLHRVLQDYLADELARAHVVRQKFEQLGPIVAYGFGDNFFKSIASGGPLDGILIAAIIDMRHKALNQSSYANKYRFLDIETCCAEFPESTYVVSVSWGSLEIFRALQDRGIRDIYLI